MFVGMLPMRLLWFVGLSTAVEYVGAYFYTESR
jgi:hypothetical protein